MPDSNDKDKSIFDDCDSLEADGDVIGIGAIAELEPRAPQYTDDEFEALKRQIKSDQS